MEMLYLKMSRGSEILRHPANAIAPILTAVFIASMTTPFACAIEIEDGATMFGLNAGIGAPEGGSSKSLGQPVILGGQFFYDRMGEWGTGLQFNHFNFKSKNGNRANMTSVLLVGRANIPTKSDTYLPYLLAGIGYSESGAQMSGGGTDQGSGIGWCLGGGFDRFLTERFSAGLEFRLDRMAAPLPHIGLSGGTVASILLRLNTWFGPEGSPFESGHK